MFEPSQGGLTVGPGWHSISAAWMKNLYCFIRNSGRSRWNSSSRIWWSHTWHPTALHRFSVFRNVQLLSQQISVSRLATNLKWSCLQEAPPGCLSSQDFIFTFNTMSAYFLWITLSEIVNMAEIAACFIQVLHLLMVWGSTSWRFSIC